MRFRPFLLTLALLLPVAAMAMPQAYRWKDANGVTHFSDSPPAQGVPYEIIRVNTGTVQEPPPAASDDEPDAPAPASAAPSAASQRVADTPENRQRLCDQLAENIRLLQSERPVVMGERALSPEERSTQLSQSLAQQAEFCSGN